MMHTNIGQETSRVGDGVVPAGTVVRATSGPNSGGNTSHTVPTTAVLGASNAQVPLSGCSQDAATVGCFFQRQAVEHLRGYLSKHRWPTGDSFW